MAKIDLQVHTNSSDGIFSAKEIIDLSIKKGIKVLAITDHNSVAGLKEAEDYSKDKNIEFVPGIELSCKEKSFQTPVIDVLGLFIDYENSNLKQRLFQNKFFSVSEAVKIIKESGGIPILAHPGRYLNEVVSIIDFFISVGGKAIEVYYPYEKVIGVKNIEDKIKKIAKEKNLLISGGSDFHGNLRGVELGECNLSESEYTSLKNSAKLF